MKRYNQRGIRGIAAHEVQGQRALALPGDALLTNLERPAESRDQIVGRVRTSENRPPAEVETHNVGR